jgi:hypothetical protein
MIRAASKKWDSARACALVLGLLLPGASGLAAQTTQDTVPAGAPGDTTRRLPSDTAGSTPTDMTDEARAAATGVFAPAPAAAPSAGRPAPAGTSPSDIMPGGTSPSDTTPGGTVPGGTAPGGTVPGGTMPAGTMPGDTAPGGTRPYVGPTTTVVSLGPSDTTLARVCQGMTAGTQAPGVLAVLFRAGTSDPDRVAAAKSVGGRLGGPSLYGEEYVLLPPDAGPLTMVADRLIRQESVTQVSPAPCPPTEETSTIPPSGGTAPTGAAGTPPDTSGAMAPPGVPKGSP